MESQPEKAFTRKLPSPKDVSFLTTICPDWAKIDIIGQTILLAELIPHFGSFQNACRALKLQSNEVESFLLTYYQYQQDREQGRQMVEQWGREQAVPSNMNKDIPQQRHVLISLSSIVPACEFLKTLGYQDCIPAVQAWTGRTMTWPPDINVASLDLPRLDQSDVVFPQPRGHQQYTKYTSSLGNDPRAVVAFVGAWQTGNDGTPDTRISFIDLPEGSMAHGPHGPRRLSSAGRYYICWPANIPSHSSYNDFVLARNVSDTCNNKDILFESPAHNVSGDTTQSGLEESQYPDPEGLNTNQGSSAAPVDTFANPKDIFGSNVPAAHAIQHPVSVPFLSETEPEGPQQKLPNPQLQQMWDTWPGDIFQFRLPRGYCVLGPQGHVFTFDPSELETYDELGNPQGIGGMYFVVPRPKSSLKTTFRMGELPAHIALRFKTSQRLVIVRNSMVLPRFLQPGVHEWSVQEGFLDLYNAHGCYDVLRTEGCYTILPEAITNSSDQGIDHNHGHVNGYAQAHGNEFNHRNGNAKPTESPIEEALKLLAPHRDWLAQQEEETKRHEQEARERARLGARSVMDKARRESLREEREARKRVLQTRQAQETDRINAVIAENMTTAQSVQTRRARQKQSSDGQPNTNTSSMPTFNPQSAGPQQQEPIGSSDIFEPKVTAREKALPKQAIFSGPRYPKRALGDKDKEYKPTKYLTSHLKKGSDPNATPIAKGRQTRATSGPNAASTPGCQQPSTPAGTRPQRAAANRKPIGPLLDAIKASKRNGDTSLSLTTPPVVDDDETESDGRNDETPSKPSKITLRVRNAKPSISGGKAPLNYDPDGNKGEKEI
ncbi:hypothetical protein GGR55DRAFT_527452 [Xylaria sp. FL0064]|nr:hypothetical protein GGR55DRAFT_527452 [Xylaria sp. FL0064]